MTASVFERPSTCDATTGCRCEEFASSSLEAGRLIEETWAIFEHRGVNNDDGNELHFRILPYTGGGRDESLGRIEAFLLRRQCGTTWPRFAESHVFHLTDRIEPHLKRAALLAQFEVRPPRTQQELLDALASGQT